MYNEQEYLTFSKQMEERFPKMFVKGYGGIGVGKGWWPIIERLCDNIQSHIDSRAKQVIQFPNENYQPVKQVEIRQIKEKFGGLRFYYDGGDDRVYGMVRMAESWASVSCEDCGAPGEQTGGGWIKTLCPTHAAERAERSRIAEMKAGGFEE